MFKHDSWLQGILSGLALIIITASVIYLLIPLIGDSMIVPKEKAYILGIVPNLLLLRWFYKTKKLIKTGNGILIVTIIATIGFLFWLKFGL